MKIALLVDIVMPDGSVECRDYDGIDVCDLDFLIRCFNVYVDHGRFKSYRILKVYGMPEKL